MCVTMTEQIWNKGDGNMDRKNKTYINHSNPSYSIRISYDDNGELQFERPATITWRSTVHRRKQR